jgi:acyl-CoA dehydrogenase
MFVIFAKTNPETGHRGISAFLVNRDNPGLSVGEPLGKLGQRAGPAAEVFLNDVDVHESARIDAEGDGFLIAMRVFDRSRPMVAALAVGLIQRAFRRSARLRAHARDHGTNADRASGDRAQDRRYGAAL